MPSWTKRLSTFMKTSSMVRILGKAFLSLTLIEEFVLVSKDEFVFDDQRSFIYLSIMFSYLL